jgi:uncharacterized protein (UPF0303 family)
MELDLELDVLCIDALQMIFQALSIQYTYILTQILRRSILKYTQGILIDQSIERSLHVFVQYRENGPGWNSTSNWTCYASMLQMIFQALSIQYTYILTQILRRSILKYTRGILIDQPIKRSLHVFVQYRENGPGWNSTSNWT